MCNPLFVAVQETFDELDEEESREGFVEPSGNGYEVEELTTQGKFEDNELHLLLGAIGFLVGSDAELLLLDDVFVIESGHGLYLSHDKLLGLLIDIVQEDLDCNFPASVGVKTKLYLAGGA